jgi:drug/metabolite transporter (DMT)-like permease
MVSTSRLKNWGLLLICNLIWGSQFVFLKIVQRQMGPLFASLIPLGFSTLMLIPLVKMEGPGAKTAKPDSGARRSDVVGFILLGVLGQALAMIFGTWAVRLTLATDAALLNLALPVTTAVMAYLLLGERMSVVRALSFVLAIVGVLECSGIRWRELNFTNPQFVIGNAFCLISVAASAFYNTYSKPLLARYSLYRVILYTYLTAFAVMLPITIYVEPQSFRNMAHFTPLVWVSLAFLAFLRNFLALIIFLYVLKRLDATVAGLSNYLIPFFGVLTASLFLGEKLTNYMIVGGLLVLGSTLLTTITEGRGQRNVSVQPTGVALDETECPADIK